MRSSWGDGGFDEDAAAEETAAAGAGDAFCAMPTPAHARLSANIGNSFVFVFILKIKILKIKIINLTENFCGMDCLPSRLTANAPQRLRYFRAQAR